MKLILVPITSEERERLPQPSEVKGRYLNWIFWHITDPKFGTFPFGRWLGPEAEGVEYENRRFYKKSYELRTGVTLEWWMRIEYEIKNNSEWHS